MTRKIAVIETNKGTIKFELFEKESPKTAENFCLLAERGYYDGLTFHRVIRNFIIQGGDPLGTGYGGQSAWGGFFEDEIRLDSPLYEGVYERGIVAMANAGPNTNGSQFFIMHADYPLPPKYTKFGKVIEGMDVVDAIAETETDENDRPLETIVMNKVYILR
ncbi:MAG: peptidylprolyl isomerase [Pyrinomonadaceae bacterium]|nr:peptidylprolyl isomerase [Pyrinomonadaceae bacterium]MCX7639540.1 peptidylprolyl isomerase [Pyrinomonadaceae bacterium]MDW8304409.1 peptidylprolyl isomerase [Acidobacteriota bacterium]